VLRPGAAGVDRRPVEWRDAGDHLLVGVGPVSAAGPRLPSQPAGGPQPAAPAACGAAVAQGRDGRLRRIGAAGRSGVGDEDQQVADRINLPVVRDHVLVDRIPRQRCSILLTNFRFQDTSRSC